MRKIIATIVLSLSLGSAVFSQTFLSDSIKPYVDFLKSEPFLSPKEYILKSFEDKDIIVLSERLHPEFKQYEMIAEVLNDNRFTGNIYTEIGGYNIGKQINELVMKEGLPDSEVKQHILDILKNLTTSPLWENYNYYYLIESIYKINQQRKADEKIKLYPLDVIFSWSSMKCEEQYHMASNMMEAGEGFPAVIDRNIIMAQHFVKIYNQEREANTKKQKALVIMNSYHGYTRIPQNRIHPTEPSIYSTAEYIYKTFPQATKGISINGLSNAFTLVANGKWDAAFRYNGNKNIGFDLKNTPFGKTKFDMYNFGGSDYESANFEFIFDGLVFYEPIDNFEIVVGLPGIFDDPEFLSEFFRRASIAKGITVDEAKSSNEVQQYIKDANVKKSYKFEDIDRYKGIIQGVNKWLAQ